MKLADDQSWSKLGPASAPASSEYEWVQCDARHPVNGKKCQYTVRDHPRLHCAIYSTGNGETAFCNWPVASQVVYVEAPPYRIVSVRYKRMLMAGAVLAGLSTLGLLLWVLFKLQNS